MASNADRRAVERARAKINLTLHVVGRRGDGYHLLESFVVFAEAGDELAFAPADRFSLEVAGPFGGGLSGGGDNLVLRAAHALSERFPGRIPPARMTLAKHLPVSSGIGGGSADAAATLRGLCALAGLSPDGDTLHELARRLGADVPVCLESRATVMAGIGERLSPAPGLPPHGAVLVNPGHAVSTPDVFARLDLTPGEGAGAPHPPLPAGGWRTAEELAGLLGACRNDLEIPARALVPEIDRVLDALEACPGTLLARMSGSGATCFALFGSRAEADAAADRIATAHPGWWVAATTFR
ncbi:4-(cytidine 5'-diphospho)-2-C-methyl-D-erythritol kinase [Kaustia mangrovi]|uniref:4-diphosphocytidyl-2-C-methyl-D-erythritol kinase n=1 Tax=Kaustia mangrovi TaxID=2593653 RepID=A0A7S8C2E4_9HYPH|nr:4-(cytidine 5'-diphospho)-2-C-methyl-D-erythritol kinase [Kaustia mangrovi]QPC42101.1 4-(cytidine 5'-diphospho)-2-C-methyl-D-erythritol kinase [Kaustia mangrovi]